MSEFWNIAQSIATIAAAVFALPMIYFATKQVRLAADAYKVAADQSVIAAKAASTAAMVSLTQASRELQWKVVEDDVLRPILLPAHNPDHFNPEMKRALVRGILISHYASVYEFYALGLIPESTWSGYAADMLPFFTERQNQRRWDELRSMYPKNFQSFVDNHLLKRP